MNGHATGRCGRWYRAIRKVGRIPGYAYRLVSARGLRKAVLCVASELYSTTRYVVTHHDLRAPVKLPAPELPIEIAEVKATQMQRIEEICRIWPPEFGHWRPESLKEKITHDLIDDNWCFCARANGEAIGVIWMLKGDEGLRSCSVHHLPGERIVGKTFVVPQARGMGLGNLLYNHTVQMAAERGVPQLFGFTFPHRVASIKAKLRVGFTTIGALTIRTRWGRSTYTFIPHAESGQHDV